MTGGVCYGSSWVFPCSTRWYSDNVWYLLYVLSFDLFEVCNSRFLVGQAAIQLVIHLDKVQGSSEI